MCQYSRWSCNSWNGIAFGKIGAVGEAVVVVAAAVGGVQVAAVVAAGVVSEHRELDQNTPQSLHSKRD